MRRRSTAGELSKWRQSSTRRRLVGVNTRIKGVKLNVHCNWVYRRDERAHCGIFHTDDNRAFDIAIRRRVYLIERASSGKFMIRYREDDKIYPVFEQPHRLLRDAKAWCEQHIKAYPPRLQLKFLGRAWPGAVLAWADKRDIKDYGNGRVYVHPVHQLQMTAETFYAQMT